MWLRRSLTRPSFRPLSSQAAAREDGQATLEMVVSLTVAFSLVFWLFELCMFTYTCSVLNDAAQEGVATRLCMERQLSLQRP